MTEKQKGKVQDLETIKAKPDTTEFQHSLLCALTLPRSCQTNREYRRDYQGRSLKLEAGELWNGREWAEQPLPYGTKARLALMHICSDAVKRQSPFVDLGDSARAFMEKIGVSDDGKQYRMFRQQMNALAACRVKLGFTTWAGKVATVSTQPIKQFNAWIHNEGGQRSIWGAELQLSDEFFRDLIKHAVPLSGNAIRALSGSALALDAYALLSYRLHALERPTPLTWEQLREQIGQEYTNAKDFKKELLPAMQAALAVYPSAKVEQIRGGLTLHPSPPPIARQSIGVSRGLADKVKEKLTPHSPQKPLSPRVIETFKRKWPRLDVYACEADFIGWLETTAREQPKNYGAAFMGFARKWATQREQ